jgi:uncharacterized membrane protein
MKFLRNTFFGKHHRLWLISLVLLTSANLAYYVHDIFGWAITLTTFLILPGYLLLKLLKIETESQWISGSFSVALSLFLLMTTGLAVNSLQIFGQQHPLSTVHIFVALDIVTSSLIFCSRKVTYELRKLEWQPGEKIPIALLTLMPLLAIAGAIRLNNGAPDTITLVLFVIIAIMFVWIVMRRKGSEWLQPYALFMFTLSLLLSISLRGWFITGADVQREFFVSQLTLRNGVWDIATFRDPYNACLSITILPTMLAKLTTIPDAYIFKFVLQIAAAWALLPIYFLLKRFSSSKIAFISAFVFISLPNFLNSMPWALRQEIAFIFFASLLLVVLYPISHRAKTTLTFLLLFGLVEAHYSSTYIALAVFAVSWIIFKVITPLMKPSQKYELTIPTLDLAIILVAFLVTFLWNSQLTSTTSGLKQTISGTIATMFDQSTVRSGDVSYSLLNTPAQNSQTLLAQYARSNNFQAQYFAVQTPLPLTTVGKTMSKFFNVFEFNNVVRALSAKVLQLLLLVGIIVLFFKYKKQVARDELYLFSLMLGFVLLLVLQTLLPQLSVDYGTQRFFQQAVMVLGLPITIGCLTVFRFLPKLTQQITACFFAFLFLHLSGFIPQVLGGYPPQLALSNSGSAYDIYYVHGGEVLSANWLLRQKQAKVVAVDRYAQIRLLNAVLRHEITTTVPSNQNPGIYLYQDYTNVKNEIYMVDLKSQIIAYKYAIRPDNGNLVYANASSRIYKY